MILSANFRLFPPRGKGKEQQTFNRQERPTAVIEKSCRTLPMMAAPPLPLDQLDGR
jgi:hypothetical protein